MCVSMLGIPYFFQADVLCAGQVPQDWNHAIADEKEGWRRTLLRTQLQEKMCKQPVPHLSPCHSANRKKKNRDREGDYSLK